MKPVYISYETIEALHPCADQLREVRKLFGKRKRMAVTVKRAVALASRFNFDWLANHALSRPAKAAYNAAKAPARAAYDAATAPAGAAYHAATAPAGATYRAAIAQAWARCYIKQQRGRA